jgi:hypothetical protein
LRPFALALNKLFFLRSLYQNLVPAILALVKLHLTEKNSDVSLVRVRFLVKRGARVKGSGALQAAAGGGLPHIINNLLSDGADAGEIEEAIKTAKKSGHDEAVEILQDYRLSLK